MEENQTNQNLNQQPVQPQPEQFQQPVQWQPIQQQSAQNQQQVQQQPVQQQPQPAQPSASMQIQQLLVQQQQYQKQYNELVDYVKKTPNLPIEQVNQIKAQLDQLNALFVQGKQQLQALWYTQVQVTKPAEVKKWSVSNFSWKKVAIWCSVVLLLIFAWFFLTLSSLIKNPNALAWIWVYAATAKMLLQAFTGLIFWSVILVMLGVIISNIYRLITVKNQWKWKFIRWLIWWFVWAGAMWALIWIIFWQINKIETEAEQIDYDIIQPYLVWRVENEWIDEFTRPYDNETIAWVGNKYPLIAPSEIAFSLRWDELTKLTNQEFPAWYEIVGIKLLCGNKDGTILDLQNNTDNHWWYKFWWTCLYSEKWTYTHWIEITYDNTVSRERKTETYSLKSLEFTSEVSINNKAGKLSSEGWEFRLWKAPAKITVDTSQVFRDFSTKWYEVEWDMDWDFTSDRTNIVNFDYSYKVPQVYYVGYKFPEIYDDLWYRFPVRVEPSDVPVCEVNLAKFPWTSGKFQISTNFIDGTLPSTISSYKYTMINRSTNQILEEKKNENQKISYEFPDKWNYVVVVDYVTVDWKQWQCESDLIQLEKEEFDVEYLLQAKDPDSWKFKDICSSRNTDNNNCTEINLETIPQTYQLKIQSITPVTKNTTQWVYFEEEKAVENTHSLMEDNNVYEFTVPNEWNYELRIITSDKSSGIDDATKIIKIYAEKPDIVWIISITSGEEDSQERKQISEGFSPLTVFLDASKTEVNIPWDEIIYFTWDFGDGQVKQNQQNWIVSHTYSYDYVNENWIFTPTVTVKTLKWETQVIKWPTLHIKKQLVDVNLMSTTHPSWQAPIGSEVGFLAEFDGMPEKMTRDFWDGTPVYSCQWRVCADLSHLYDKKWVFTVKVSLDFDSIQQVKKEIKEKLLF